MKGKTLFITLFAILNMCSLFAQEPTATVEYRIDYFKPDSIYLVEVRTKQLGAGLRPEITEAPIFARDTAEIVAMIASVKKQASEAASKARDLDNLANEVNKVYGVLRQKLSEIPKQ